MNNFIKIIFFLLFSLTNLYASINIDSLFSEHIYIERYINENLDDAEILFNDIKEGKYESLPPNNLALFEAYFYLKKDRNRELVSLVDSSLKNRSLDNITRSKLIYYQSIAYNDLKLNKKSIKILSELLEENYELDLDLTLKFYEKLGEYLIENADYEKAFSILLKASEIAKKKGELGEFFKIKSLIASYYRKQGQYNKSIEITKKSIEYFEETKDSTKLADAYSNTGYSYLYLENVDSAQKYLDKAVNIYSRKSQYAYANNLLLYSSVYHLKNDIDSSLWALEKALEINISLNNEKGIINCYDMLHGFYFLMSESKQDLIKSVDYAKEALKLLEGTKQDTTIYYPIYKSIADIYEKLDQSDSAFQFLMEYSIRLERIKEIEKNKSFKEILESHELELKDLEIGFKNEQIDLQKSRNFIIIIFSLLLLVLSVIIYIQFRRNRSILLKILPEKVARQLKKRKNNIGEHFDEAAVVFIDIAGFTEFCHGKEPEFLVELLNNTFEKFDFLAKKYNIEKIKTIGDCYMAASGVPQKDNQYLENIISFSKEILETIDGFKTEVGWEVKFRYGIHLGDLVAGVIGESKFSYDLWGETVNFASRLAETGDISKIHISKEVKQKLGDSYNYEKSNKDYFKGFGNVQTYYLKNQKAQDESN